jgi:hypothetical protein
MKRFFFVLFALSLTALFSCLTNQTKTTEPEPNPIPRIIFRLPEPERVFFYRDGTTVYEAKIPTEAIINNSFILPQQVDRNNFTIFQNGKRIFSYSLIAGQVLIQFSDEDPRNPEVPLVELSQVLLVTVSELQADSPLDVRFGIGRSGISWRLVLDMETAEENTLNCNLLASITLEASSRITGAIESILAKRPEIVLISSNNVFIEGSDTMFNLGNPLIESGKTTFIKLEEGKSSYRLVYVWDAENKDSPDAFLYCSNPFTSSLSSIEGLLKSAGLNIRTFSSLRLTPGRQFELLVGNQPLISTFKSALTQEFPEKEYPNRANLPFTHTLEYRATNNLGVPAELEISIPVTYGKVHRTQYKFVKQPDERPGDRMIWKYKLDPNANANLEFSFDAERKDNSRYSDYDYYQGGR